MAKIALESGRDSASNFRLPRGTCDTHCHVFGPFDRFPVTGKLHYTPHETPKEVLAALHARIGVDRAVIVQASVHGVDNRVVIDAIASNPAKYRGVAMIDDATSERDLRDLNDGGVRGARFNFNRNLGGFPDMELVKRSVERIKGLGWHLVMQIDGVDIPVLTPFIRALPVPFVIDHMGRCDAAAGIGQSDFKGLLELMKLDNAWIKLTCPERMTKFPYAAAVPFARALLEARPDRVLWGTDFPHPNLPQPPDAWDLVNLAPQYAHTADEQRRLLVDNPARLYGFPD